MNKENCAKSRSKTVGAAYLSTSTRAAIWRLAYVPLISAPLWLNGCMLGADFEQPKADLQQTWVTPEALGDVSDLKAPEQKGANVSAVVSAGKIVPKWWETFNDATLVSLIERALDSNLDLKQAVSRIRQARAQQIVVASPLFPQLDAVGNYQTDHTGDGQSEHSGFSASNSSELYRVGLDAVWELDIFGGRRREYEAAEADTQAQIENHRDVFVSLAAEVSLNYFALRGLQQELEITRQNVQAQKSVADLTEQRYKAGFANALDMANAYAQVASTRAELPPLEAAAQKRIFSLSVLLGLQPVALRAELETMAPIASVPPQVPIGIPSEILRRRPDIRRTEAQLHAATARVGASEADLFPKFSITAALGLQGQGFSSLGYWDNHSWSVTPAVSLPLFNAGRIRANIEIQNELEEQSLLEYQKVVLNALSEVESALVDYQREQEHRLALADAVAANERALELARRLYASGTADFLNVLTAQRALFLSQAALVRSVANVDQNLVALYKALGGGWEVVNPENP